MYDDTDLPDVRYSDPSHETFNQQRFGKPDPVSKLDIDTHWLQKPAPDVSFAFDKARRPPSLANNSLEPIAIDDEERQGERGSSMVERNKPAHDLRPPPNIRDPVERDHFNARWMTEQRNAAFANAAHDQTATERENELTRHQSREYSR